MKTILTVLVSLLWVSAGWAEVPTVMVISTDSITGIKMIPAVPARRHVDKSDVRYIGNGQYQAEITIGRHTEVFIFTTEGAKESRDAFDKALGETFSNAVEYRVNNSTDCCSHYDAKPAAR